MIGKIVIAFYLIFVAPVLLITMAGLIYGAGMEFHKAFILKEKK